MNQPSSPSNLQLFFRYTHPWSLLAAILTYVLGGGIAKYLGHTLHFSDFLAGMLAIVLLMLAGYVLKLYYDLVDGAGSLRAAQQHLDEFDQAALQRLSRPYVLFTAFTILTAGAATTVLLIAQGALSFPGLVILGLAFLLAFFYAVPPVRLVYRGYGELVEAILITSLSPALAFILQTGDLHRLLPMLTFPLMALFLALRLAQSLEHYARDQKLFRRTMMVAIGWQRGMQFHNLLILAGYLLLVVAAAFSMPWQLTWPGLLTLPVGLFQVIQMNQIIAGAKPGWRLLRLTSAATFALTGYLLSLAIWTT